MTTTPPIPPPPDGLEEPAVPPAEQPEGSPGPETSDEREPVEQEEHEPVEQEEPEPVEEEEPEPFSEGPPPLPEPMLVLDGTLPPPPAPVADEPVVDHGTCGCGGAYDADGWCTECGSRRPDPRHHFSAQPDARVAAVCDRGLRHEDNEDAMAVWADGTGRAALVVCDGVTTATRSSEASLAAGEAALEVLVGNALPPPERLVAATDAAAEAVEQVGRDFPGSAPSCTYVAALVQDGTATVGSVGDSRAYWLPDAGEPIRLTADDSVAEEQVQAGVDRQTAETGPMAHTITRWLGPDSPDHTPVVTAQDVTAPGWLLLCSDGLWNYASEPRALREVVRTLARPTEGDPHTSSDPLALAEALVGWANGRGGADNITVALVRTPARQDGTHG